MVFLYINLVFESGGIKGLAYVGAIKYFEENGYRVFMASGASVGSIFAALVISGYRASEIKEIIEEMDAKDLLKLNTVKDGFKTKGLYNVSGLETKVEEVLSRKGITTFSDVKFGEDYLLKIVVTDSKTKKMVILPDELPLYGFNKDTFKIAKAIAMSCSIPFFYSVYKCDKYHFVDGGATYKFPLELVLDNNRPTYGLKISEDNRFIDKVQDIVYKTKKNTRNLDNEDKKIHIININTLDIKATQFSKGFYKKNELYHAGYISTARYFSK